jgi:hypothetical protein
MQSENFESERAGYPFRIVLFASGQNSTLPPPHLMFDPVADAGTPPAATMVEEITQVVAGGGTVVLACVDRRRRNYTAKAVRHRGFRAKLLARPEEHEVH